MRAREHEADALEDELHAMADALLATGQDDAAVPILRVGPRTAPRRGKTLLVATVAALAAAAAVLLLLRPTDAHRPSPAPVAAPAPTPDAGASVDPPPVDAAELDRAAIRRAVAEQFVPTARTCHNALLRRNSTAEGRVAIRFGVIARDGRGLVDRAEIAEDPEIRDETFHQCLLDAMLAVVFEPPGAEGRVEVVYPIIFQRPGTETMEGSATVVGVGDPAE